MFIEIDVLEGYSQNKRKLSFRIENSHSRIQLAGGMFLLHDIYI